MPCIDFLTANEGRFRNVPGNDRETAWTRPRWQSACASFYSLRNPRSREEPVTLIATHYTRLPLSDDLAWGIVKEANIFRCQRLIIDLDVIEKAIEIFGSGHDSPDRQSRCASAIFI